MVAVISEVITLDDEDEDPLKGMKLNLHETYLQYRRNVDESSPCYSPTQSPIYVPGSPYSPGKDFQIVDLTSPYSPCSPPPLPPPSPPCEAPPLPPLPPQEPTSILSRHGEPLPPGESEDPTSPPRHISQDMDIETETETLAAETQFFLSQQKLFPASVWDFSNPSKSEVSVNGARDETEEGEITEEPLVEFVEDRVGLKRKANDESESQTSQDEEEALDEEEASLRSLLLAQVEKSKKPKIVSDGDTPSNPAEDSPANINHQATSKSKSPKGKTKSSVKFKKVKIVQKPKVKKVDSKLKSRSKPTVTITEAEQKKYFPNLSKKVVVNFSGNQSDDSDEENSQPLENNSGMSDPPRDNLFGLDLEAFLKQARNSSETLKGEKEKKAAGVVQKKIALTPQLKAQASRLTLEDKKKIISAKITHLSHSKQIEYQRLKEILAKKQREKLLKIKLAKENVIAEIENKKSENNLPSQQGRMSSITEEEDEETLRNTLISEMKKKNIQIPAAPRENLSSIDMPKKSVSIEIAENYREVKLKEDEAKDLETSPQKKKLKTMEMDLIKMRKGLSQSLFKLSAYMSQLQKETSSLDSALKYIEELKKQLKETEVLVMSREKKVDSLREVIRESHMQITVQKQDMTRKEQECIDVGMTIQGEDYKPPVDGAENIRKKLEMIRNTANKVKTVTEKTSASYSSEPSGSGGVKSGNIDSGLPGDYRSPLEHLNQGKGVILDHSKELCRYELAGKCLDQECKMQHLNK